MKRIPKVEICLGFNPQILYGYAGVDAGIPVYRNQFIGQFYHFLPIACGIRIRFFGIENFRFFKGNIPFIHAYYTVEVFAGLFRFAHIEINAEIPVFYICQIPLVRQIFFRLMQYVQCLVIPFFIHQGFGE